LQGKKDGCIVGAADNLNDNRDETMGLYFDILAVPADLIHERRGRVQRKAGIDPRWFHHPDAAGPNDTCAAAHARNR